MVNNENNEWIILKKIRTLFFQKEICSKIIISGMTKELQRNRKQHFHDIFEIRFLFGYDKEQNVDYGNLLEIRLTPEGFVHYGLEKIELMAHISLKFDLHSIFFVVGMHQINISIKDNLTNYGINIRDLLTVLYAYCQGKLDDLEHLSFVLAQFVSALACLMGKSAFTTMNLPTSQICNYIHDHYYHSDLSAADIAQVVGLSVNYIQQLFRKNHNSTIHEYLVDYRLHIAQRLLKQKKYQIKEVARLSGWNCPHYFSNCYRIKYGHPPRDE